MQTFENSIVLGSSELGLHGGDDEAFRMLDAYVALGGRLIDTAAIYSDWIAGEIGRSERIIGDWLRKRGRPDNLLISTKGGHPLLEAMDVPRLDRHSLHHDLHESLRRLCVEQVDLYFLHRDDIARPVEDILAPLATFRDEGKIARVGLSNWSTERIEAAIEADIVPIVSNQVFGNILARLAGPLADPTIVRIDADSFKQAKKYNLSMLLFSSQCQGYFHRRHLRPEAVKPHYSNAACTHAADRIATIAADLGLEPTALSIAFLLQFFNGLFPIIGPKSVDQLESTFQAQSLDLSQATMSQLSSVSRFSDFLATTDQH